MNVLELFAGIGGMGLGNAVVPQVSEFVARLVLSGRWADA